MRGPDVCSSQRCEAGAAGRGQLGRSSDSAAVLSLGPAELTATCIATVAHYFSSQWYYTTACMVYCSCSFNYSQHYNKKL